MECIEALVAYGANINHNISHLGTPLYLACEKQQLACVKKLLESGKSGAGGARKENENKMKCILKIFLLGENEFRPRVG